MMTSMQCMPMTQTSVHWYGKISTEVSQFSYSRPFRTLHAPVVPLV